MSGWLPAPLFMRFTNPVTAPPGSRASVSPPESSPSFVRVGLDIGGTKIHAVAIDPAGRVVAQTRVPSGFGPVEVVANAARAALQVTASAGAPQAPLSVGVGIPGLVDRATGHVRHAVNLGLREVDFARELTALVHAPVTVENDVNAAALGVYRALRSAGALGYVNVGTGLAAGLIVDGRLWRGSRGVSGEIGHLPVDPAGAVCPCGQRGCLETLASGSAIARQWPSSDRHPARALFAAADAGDPAATAVRARFADGLAAAVRTIIMAVGVDQVVIGGGLSNLGAPLLADVKAALTTAASRSTLLTSLEMDQRVRLAPSHTPFAAAGAALGEALLHEHDHRTDTDGAAAPSTRPVLTLVTPADRGVAGPVATGSEKVSS